VKKTSGQKLKTKGLPKKPAAKKTMIGTGSKKRPGKKMGASKRRLQKEKLNKTCLAPAPVAPQRVPYLRLA